MRITATNFYIFAVLMSQNGSSKSSVQQMQYKHSYDIKK